MAFLQELRSGLMAVTIEYNTLSAKGEDTFVAEAKYSALSEVWAWVKEGSWSKNADFVARVIVLLEQGTDKAMNTLGLKNKSHANTLVWRANTILEEKMGVGVVTKILAGQVDEAMLEFRLKTGKSLSEQAFVAEVKNMLPDGDSSTIYDLKDCLDEAKFLATYSRAWVTKRFNAVDKKKLAYLVYLLNGYDSQLLPEQQALIRFVNGDIKATELTNVVNPFRSGDSLPQT